MKSWMKSCFLHNPAKYASLRKSFTATLLNVEDCLADARAIHRKRLSVATSSTCELESMKMGNWVKSSWICIRKELHFGA